MGLILFQFLIYHLLNSDIVVLVSWGLLSFSNVDPITGLVDKIKVLQKSDGLPGEFELLNEVSVPFSSSFDIKVPIPSKNLKDPKILKPSIKGVNIREYGT